MLDRTGYLSSNPYLANNVTELLQLATDHPCPCCGKTVYSKGYFDDIDSSQPDNPCFSSVAQCQCGFVIPFHAILLQKPKSPQNQPFKAPDLSQIDENVTVEQTEALMLQCRYLLHTRQYQQTLDLVEPWSVHCPWLPLLPFYQAYAQQMQGNIEQAMQSYDHCLDIDPECMEAWHNKAQLLKQLGRVDESNFNLVKYFRLGCAHSQIIDKTTTAEPSIPPLALNKGMFGDIRIWQTANTRYLTIDEELEGSFWLLDGQASDVPACDYAAGLLLAGCHFNARCQTTSGLMLGLGAGSGVVMLLANFEQLNLTVVEIDPVLIDLSCKYFPKLNEYIRQGRLKILCRDAFDYIEKFSQANEPEYDFAILDIYLGDRKFAAKLTNKQFLGSINAMANLIGVNLIVPKTCSEYSEIIDAFANAGVGIKQYFPTGTRGTDELPFGNRILYSQHIRHIDEFVPYLQQEGYLYRAFRRDFNHVLLNAQWID